MLGTAIEHVSSIIRSIISLSFGNPSYTSMKKFVVQVWPQSMYNNYTCMPNTTALHALPNNHQQFAGKNIEIKQKYQFEGI